MRDSGRWSASWSAGTAPDISRQGESAMFLRSDNLPDRHAEHERRHPSQAEGRERRRQERQHGSPSRIDAPVGAEQAKHASRRGPARRVRMNLWPFSAASSGSACQGRSARRSQVHTRLSWQSAEHGRVRGPVPPASSSGWCGRSSNPCESPGIPGTLQPRPQGKPDSSPCRPSCSTSPPLQPIDALASAGERFRVYFHSSYRTRDPCRASRQPVSPGADSRSGGTGIENRRMVLEYSRHTENRRPTRPMRRQRGAGPRGDGSSRERRSIRREWSGDRHDVAGEEDAGSALRFGARNRPGGSTP